MTEVKRTYDATNRQQRARERRRAVVAAAQELFEREGFRATTIAAVARAAGVSAESIYKGFGTKAALAKAVFDFVVAGDDEPVPMAERPEVQAVRAEPDPRRKLALYAEGLARRQHRSAKVQLLIRDGRHVDDTLEGVWQKLLAERLHGMTLLAADLHATGRLRPGLDADEVRDLLWTYISVELYELLVLNRGWPLRRYTTWLTNALAAALCP
ncbi:TetR family transcriptional regulator [Kribbella voronezhensis]|uniref:TetR family transcriptional regulator n=2 Tax=Kribbella voronezhensis TaxID=2512212 RepID=A0A4R7TA23_9ACTN|nr:TetR family transcriptional regulator [Kribbella voronezhensis]